MPCNVAVRERGGWVPIDVMNANLMATMFPEARLEGIGKKLTDRFRRVIAAI